jgi:hypothetical protein
MQLRSGGNYASPCNPNPCGRCGDLVQRARCCIGTGHNFNSTSLPYLGGLSTPVTSTVTNCMMLCNSQVANCQAGCFVPAPPVPSAAASTTSVPFPTPILNATVNPACTTGCTSVQHCARKPPYWDNSGAARLCGLAEAASFGKTPALAKLRRDQTEQCCRMRSLRQ